MVFATIGDDKYFELLELCVQQINKFHPKSKIYVGDLGLSENNKNILQKYATIMDINTGVNLKKTEHIREDLAYIWFLKPLFIAEVMSLSQDRCIWIDADAVLIKPFNYFFNEYNGFVTKRKSKHGAINAGVCGFTNTEVVYHWIRLASQRLFNSWGVKGYGGIEQSSLLMTANYYDFVKIKGDVYNYTGELEDIPDECVVVHLKGGDIRKNKDIPKLKELINEGA